MEEQFRQRRQSTFKVIIQQTKKRGVEVQIELYGNYQYTENQSQAFLRNYLHEGFYNGEEELPLSEISKAIYSRVRELFDEIEDERYTQKTVLMNLYGQ